MRWIKSALLVLFALALAALGAVMPFAASRLQDARQAGVEMQSFDSFLLTLKEKGELSQILRFFAENREYEFIEGSPEEAVLSEEEAEAAAMEAVEAMFRCGIISKSVLAALESNKAAGVDEPYVDMACVVPGFDLQTDPQKDAHIIWGVDWDALGIQIWLDDASGKAFQISSYNRLWDQEIYDGNASSTGMTKEQLYARMDSWNMFLENYYEVKVQDIEEIPYSYAQGFFMYIDLEDGGDRIPMRLYMHEDGDTLMVDYVE